MNRHFAQNAAYEGARTGMLPGATSSRVQAAALEILRVSGVQDGTITVTPSVLTPDDTDVTVDVSIPVDSNSFLAPMFLGGGSLQATCTLSTEVTGL